MSPIDLARSFYAYAHFIIGLPGIMDDPRGVVFWSPNFPLWENVPVAQEVGGLTHLPVNLLRRHQAGTGADLLWRAKSDTRLPVVTELARLIPEVVGGATVVETVFGYPRSEAIGRVMPIERLRYIGMSHFEADECGAMNEFLAAAPRSVPLCSRTAAMVSVDDVADRPARAMADGETISLGTRAVRWTENGVPYEVASRSLFLRDLVAVAEQVR